MLHISKKDIRILCSLCRYCEIRDVYVLKYWYVKKQPLLKKQIIYKSVGQIIKKSIRTSKDIRVYSITSTNKGTCYRILWNAFEYSYLYGVINIDKNLKKIIKN